MSLLLDHEQSFAYARALVAIARADAEISFEEGLRLKQLVDARCRVPVALDELLIAPPLDPQELAVMLHGGPFRGAAVHPSQLARALVADGIAIVLAKGHASATEADSIWQFAAALGLSRADFRTLTSAVARWFPEM